MRTCPDCQNRYEDGVLHCPQDGRGLAGIEAEDQLIGRAIGSYRVERLLGKGGMGAIYMGVHPMIGSRVAIKFLHPQYSDDEKIVDRFFNEARAVNVIGHDNILKILDLDITDDNRHYFVMEFLHGKPLQALIRHGQAVPLEVTGPILIQVCDALDAAHRKGIIHRDLKPDNVYLITLKGKKNFVKVMDFGIARLTDESGASPNLTQTGMVMGTPGYMSPEQASGASGNIDGRSDVYSLGIMMFQLATGRLPFPGSNFGEVLIGHVQQQPPRPRLIQPDIPDAYEAIILKCLEKRQEGRYQSMKELKLALEACMDGLGISKDLPPADGSEVDESRAIEARPISQPGLRTPRGHKTQPTLAPNAPRSAGSPTTGPTLRPWRASRRTVATLLAPALKSPARLFAVGLWAASAVGAGAFLYIRSAEQRMGATRAEAVKAAQRAAAEAALKKPADEAPVSLSVSSDPEGAEVRATWKDGEKRGAAPLSLEVARHATVHFEFSKAGYGGAARDVIADESQDVRASLRALPAPAAAAIASAQTSREKRHRPSRRKPENREEPGPAPSRDGLIDLDDALK